MVTNVKMCESSTIKQYLWLQSSNKDMNTVDICRRLNCTFRICISFDMICHESTKTLRFFFQVIEDFLPIISRVKSVMSSNGSSKGEISYAKEHESVWFKGRRFTPNVWANTPGELQIKQLKPAIDSKGRKVGEEWFTTIKVENALTRYSIY